MSPLSTMVKERKAEEELAKKETLDILNSLKKANRDGGKNRVAHGDDVGDADDYEDDDDEEYDDREPWTFDSWGYVPGMIFIFIGFFQLIYDSVKGNVNDTLLIAGSQVFCGFGLLLLLIGFLFRLKDQ